MKVCSGVNFTSVDSFNGKGDAVFAALLILGLSGVKNSHDAHGKLLGH